MTSSQQHQDGDAPIGLPSRNSLFWWLYVAVLAGAAVFIGHSFIGILVLGLFGYYATRPICARFGRLVDSHALAAALTVATVLVPVFLLAIYAIFRVVRQIQQQFDGEGVSQFLAQLVGYDAVGENGLQVAKLVENPPSVTQVSNLLFGPEVQQGMRIVDAVLGTLLLLTLAVTLSYALLQYDSSISESFSRVVGGPDTTVYSYGRAVDSDLESIFFGNLLFVLVMSVLATVTYALTNFFAPPGFNVPMAFTLGVFTGVASLLPIVVGKVVYLPVIGYLSITAMQQEQGYVFVGSVLVVYFLVLDILPQSFLQPYITGKQLNAIVLLFAYILGPTLFGWYGFFLLPIIFVLMLELVRVVLPELLRGNPIESTPSVAEGTGATSAEMQGTEGDDEGAGEENNAGGGGLGDDAEPANGEETRDGDRSSTTDDSTGDSEHDAGLSDTDDATDEDDAMN